MRGMDGAQEGLLWTGVVPLMPLYSMSTGCKTEAEKLEYQVIHRKNLNDVNIVKLKKH